MAAFRRMFLVLAALAFVLGGGQMANAQIAGTFACVASVAVPPLLRAEGLTEAAGDVVLNCTGGVPTAANVQIPQVNIQVFLNTSITSRLLSSNGGSEALLLVNEPPPGSQNVCLAFTSCSLIAGGNGGGSTVVTNNDYSGPGRYNVFQGIQTGTNSVTFLGVPIDQPGNAVLGGAVPTLTIRITNIRANANALGVAGPNAAPNAVFETISISGASSVPISNPVQTVGFVTPGLSAPTITGTRNFLQCNSTAFGQAFTVTVSERFATATKIGRAVLTAQGGTVGIAAQQGTPGSINNSESQTTIPVGSAVAGLADFGTRIRFVFNNIQNGVTVFVPLTIQSTNAGKSLTAVLTSSDSGSLSPVAAASGTSGQLAGLTTTAGAATAIYEITSSDPFQIETIALPVFVSFTANPGSNLPALGQSTVAVSYAPISTVTQASATAPIPRFADTSNASNAFSINSCATNLLFPFIANTAGFDTGLAISSTSADPFGTGVQGGTCTLNFYGSGAPAAFTTPNIAGGTSYTTLVSTVASGFQGYMIATCRFQFGHGFAFITDGFGGPGRGLSQGYLALVIPDVNVTGGRGPNPLGGCAITPAGLLCGTGEQLAE